MISLIYYMKSYYWFCASCKTNKNFCDKKDVMNLAIEHEKEFHKGKPVTTFGNQLFWNRTAGNTANLFDFLFWNKTSYSYIMKNSGTIFINGFITKNKNQVLYNNDAVKVYIIENNSVIQKVYATFHSADE